MAKMWFGNRNYMTWVECPAVSIDASRFGWNSQTNYLNGGTYVRSSVGGHKEYSLNWNMTTRDNIRIITDFAEGIYGQGPIYWGDPFTMNKNALPQYWATPSLNAYDGPVIMGASPDRTNLVIDPKPASLANVTSGNNSTQPLTFFASGGPSGISSTFVLARANTSLAYMDIFLTPASTAGLVYGGNSYSFSFYGAPNISGTVGIYLQWMDDANNILATGSTTTLTAISGSFNRYSLANQVAPSGTTRVRIIMRLMGTVVNNSTWSVSGFLLEQGSTVGNYFTGDSAYSYWSGDANNSTSVYHDPGLNARPVIAATGANSLGLPYESATYTVNPAGTSPTVWVPVPPGYTAWVGAYGSNGSGGTLTVTPTTGPNTYGSTSTLTLIPTTNGTWYNYSVDSTGITGIQLGFGGSGSLTITGIMVQILPTGTNPITNGFISGQGNSGCSFGTQPTLTNYSAAMDRVGLSAKLVETQAWL